MTAVAMDVDILSELDFDPALACELTGHAGRCAGDQPATWRVYGWCKGCGYRWDLVVCDSGLRRKWNERTGCGRCGDTHWWKDCYRAVPLFDG